jgi:hypothetical protein
VTNGDRLGVDVDDESAPHTQVAHAAGDDGRVRGLAAARGEDARGGDHALEVVGVGLGAHEDDVLAALGPLDGRRRRVEDDLPTAAPGAAFMPLGDEVDLPRPSSKRGNISWASCAPVTRRAPRPRR